MNNAPYTIAKRTVSEAMDARWNSPAWQTTEILQVSHFHPASSTHRPRTEAKLRYDAQGIYGIFQVEDRYVLCTHSEYGSPVCQDACVEFFVQPKPDKGYFNFEFNCGGTLLTSFIEDPTWINDPARPGEEFERYTPLPAEDAAPIQICATLPPLIDPERQEPVTWRLEFQIPFSLLEGYIGSLGDVSGQTWRANFYKCADACSHPHWGAWSPIGDELNFHRPDVFGTIHFAP